MSSSDGQVIFGISCLHHDAAIAALKGNEIVFAAHSERYSRRKNDADLCEEMIRAAVECAGLPHLIAYYERPWRRKLRAAYGGQWNAVWNVPHPRRYLRRFPQLRGIPIRHVDHHLSHAAGAYFTSPFREAAVVVVDAVGEWDTLTVWHAEDRRLRRLFRLKYPHSVGLLYTAFTRRVRLRPNEEEFILMALAAFGEPVYVDDIRSDFLHDPPSPEFRLKRSVHRGVDGWRPDITDLAGIAASIQKITSDYLLDLFRWVAAATGSPNLVFSGGVALNCACNARVAREGLFERIWIMPNPGDAGSSLGAAAAERGDWLRWRGPYLGHKIDRVLDVEGAARALARGQIVGLANGRAEFGPRALGNRSLLADPRLRAMKERVNDIKMREPFRPFAPVVLAEAAADYFSMPTDSSPYMQFAVPCLVPTSCQRCVTWMARVGFRP